jgi:hypothetical protein
LICSPPIQFRLGRDKGMFTSITPIPRIGTLTNGFLTVEVGYRF